MLNDFEFLHIRFVEHQFPYDLELMLEDTEYGQPHVFAVQRLGTVEIAYLPFVLERLRSAIEKQKTELLRQARTFECGNCQRRVTASSRAEFERMQLARDYDTLAAMIEYLETQRLAKQVEGVFPQGL